MERVFSGIQPTGDLHIGNYLGAIRNWVAIQETTECIFCVVDLHAITIQYDSSTMYRRIIDLAAGLLACGIDPKKSALFIQSEIPEHCELAWIFSSVTSMGELSRQTQYKAKSDHHADNINAGLFTYPILQAADILLYKATRVPVGADQEQHLELCREIARKFNARYSVTFPESRTMFSSTPKILGLDGSAKMSKSLNNHIAVDEEPEALRKKLAGAFTDPNRKRRQDPGNPEVCNIFSIHKFFSSDEQVRDIDHACRAAQIGCVECKRALADRMIAHFAPIRERWATLRDQPETVRDVLDEGRKRCKTIADSTMNEVRQKMGLRS